MKPKRSAERVRKKNRAQNSIRDMLNIVCTLRTAVRFLLAQRNTGWRPKVLVKTVTSQGGEGWALERTGRRARRQTGFLNIYLLKNVGVRLTSD